MTQSRRQLLRAGRLPVVEVVPALRGRVVDHRLRQRLRQRRAAQVVVEPRAPESSTLTFLKRLPTNALAFSSLPPGCLSA